MSFLAEIGFDPQFGARPLKRVMQKVILNELSKEILAGNIHQDSVVGITLDSDNKIVFENLDSVELDD